MVLSFTFWAQGAFTQAYHFAITVRAACGKTNKRLIHGTTRHDTTQNEKAWHGMAWRGTKLHDKTWHLITTAITPADPLPLAQPVELRRLSFLTLNQGYSKPQVTAIADGIG